MIFVLFRITFFVHVWAARSSSGSGSSTNTGLACCWRYSCSPGDYHTAAGCAPCPAGSYSSTVDASSCAACDAGTYAAAAGAEGCVACPAGKAQPDPGQTSCVDLYPPTPGPTEQPTEEPTSSPPTPSPTMQVWHAVHARGLAATNQVKDIDVLLVPMLRTSS